MNRNYLYSIILIHLLFVVEITAQSEVRLPDSAKRKLTERLENIKTKMEEDQLFYYFF